MAQTDYDFDARDPKAAQRELKELHAQQETLAKKINKKVFDEGCCSLKNNRVFLFYFLNSRVFYFYFQQVMNMLDKAEAEYQDLMTKRKVCP